MGKEVLTQAGLHSRLATFCEPIAMAVAQSRLNAATTRLMAAASVS